MRPNSVVIASVSCFIAYCPSDIAFMFAFSFPGCGIAVLPVAVGFIGAHVLSVYVLYIALTG
jgi:hypothetical protein